MDGGEVTKSCRKCWSLLRDSKSHASGFEKFGPNAGIVEFLKSERHSKGNLEIDFISLFLTHAKDNSHGL